MSPPAPRCALLPAGRGRSLISAVEEGGGIVVDVDDAEAIVWLDTGRPDELREVLDAHPAIRWVQLPAAGIESVVDALDDDRQWTCAKGAYARPCAEHALSLALGGMRGIGRYARETTWSEPYGYNLFGANVTILGGGEITRALLRLLQPFDCRVTVVRNRPEPLDGADHVRSSDELHDALSGADLVVLALALTPATEHIIDAEALATLEPHTWIVNVARGKHIDTDALVDALREERIGGAALDVTEPEPLPDGHPLWTLPNCIITPHIANTPEMGKRLLWERVRDNVRRFGAGQDLLGPVHVELGY